jgi:allophanate hydrolase subunit 1
VQTGIQCLASPTGWHLIGRTPARTYDPNRQRVFFLEAGDSVAFYPITNDTFESLERRAEAGEIIAEEAFA